MPEVAPSRHVKGESESLLGKLSRGFVPRAIKILSSEIFFAFPRLSPLSLTLLYDARYLDVTVVRNLY